MPNRQRRPSPDQELSGQTFYRGLGGDHTAVLRQRIDNVEANVGNIETQVNSIRDTMATRTDIGNILSRIENLASSNAASMKPNYSLMVSIAGVAILFLTMLGGFAYWPISGSLADVKLLTLTHVSQKQYDADADLQNKAIQRLRDDLNITATTTIQQQRYNLDNGKIEVRVADLEKRMLSKEEFALVANERAVALSNLFTRIQRLEDISLKK